MKTFNDVIKDDFMFFVVCNEDGTIDIDNRMVRNVVNTDPSGLLTVSYINSDKSVGYFKVYGNECSYYRADTNENIYLEYNVAMEKKNALIAVISKDNDIHAIMEKYGIGKNNARKAYESGDVDKYMKKFSKKRKSSVTNKEAVSVQE